MTGGIDPAPEIPDGEIIDAVYRFDGGGGDDEDSPGTGDGFLTAPILCLLLSCAICILAARKRRALRKRS